MIGYNHLGRNGRLGNQMFQYAALKGIAEKHEYEWCIPPSDFRVEPKAGEEKDHQLFDAFKLESVKEVKVLGAPYIQEKGFNFDQELFDNCEDNINLYGFFQSEKYFSHIEDEIKKDFTFKDEIVKPCKEMFSFGTEAISLHIRRGDYLGKQDYHPICSMEYYEEALSKLNADIPVVIFSDDVRWCKAQEIFESDRFLVSESNSNVVDLCLMTMCDYHIVANSSFSWWGAWLSNSKRVIAPKNWFGDKAELDDSDLVPERWERI
jgi:hypothetical protein